MSDLDDLRRWEEFGGAWEVVARRGDERVVSLLRCDGGEEVSRLTSADPDLRTYVDSRHPVPAAPAALADHHDRLRRACFRCRG